jgi:hypothetical protein
MTVCSFDDMQSKFVEIYQMLLSLTSFKRVDIEHLIIR